MNWIEIDKILNGMLKRHTNLADVYEEAQKQFKWTASQARVAVDPLAKRANFTEQEQQPVAKTTQKRRTTAKTKTKN